MSDISKAIEALKEDFESADNLVDEIYNKYFSRYFDQESTMYDKFRDSDVAITDKELEWVLISLPLDLKMAANALAQFKQHNEIVKLKIKQRKSNKDDNADGLDEELKLMNIIYTSVITRVELEISFSKELIMGAKKVWDARRASEGAPVNEVVKKASKLPDYDLEGIDNKLDF